VSPLSFAISSGKRAAGAGGYASPVGGEQATVLVVDDEPAIRLLCRVNLELEGYHVLEATTLAEARRVLSEGDIAAVLLDMRIGNERGETLLGELREAGVPVIVVTGSAEMDAEWAKDADAVLGKPFALDQLLGAVRSVARAR
jgi:DNA-binding response OmpR family regulator